MNKKKLMILLLTSVFAISAAGCGSNNGNSASKNNESAKPSSSAQTGSTTPGTIDFDEEPYTIKVNFAVLGEEQPDLPKIEAAMNEITLKEINAKVDLEGVSLYNMANVYAMKASSQEKMDLMLLFPGYQYLSGFAGNKMIRPIDDELQEWGPEILKTTGEIMVSGQFNGKTYGIPQRQLSLKDAGGFMLTKSILDKNNIDISQVKTLDDMDAIFTAVHEKEPSMTVLAPEVSAGSIAEQLMWLDGLGDRYGAIDPKTGKIINRYESEAWINTIKKVREWYQKGYISKDVSTSQDDGATLMNNGKVFAVSSSSVGFAGGSTQPIEKKSIRVVDPVLSTGDTQLIMWAVATSSKRPDKAIQLLNLLDSNKELTTLLRYGIKGEHYEVNQDGTIDTAKSTNYLNPWLMFGNVDLLPLSQSDVESAGLTSEQYIIKQKEWNADIKKSPGYGFMFDPSAVKTEIAALDAVSDQYVKVLGNGAVDPGKINQKYNDAMKAAGLQKVIDEKQRQYDEWIATQGK
ncbi:hypothetical protein D3C76_38260 [compost metagenome]